jgi:nucleoside-diphosphate-sugar epimerase
VPRALVTGATGLVGSYIVERLIADGWDVRALVRPSADQPTAPGLEVVRGDILDGESVVRAARECDAMFHAAAVIAGHGGWDTFHRTNIGGTQNAVTAAERAGARLLHVSSVAVYDARYGDPSEKTHEDSPLGPLPEHAFYARSKRESEALVLDAHAAGRVWATVIRPNVIYGKRDRLFVPKLARVLRTGVAPLIGGGRTTLPVVHAASVADGAVRAVGADIAGGRPYNVANDFAVTVRDFFSLAARGMGRRVHFIPVPYGLADIVFRIGLRAARMVTGGLTTVLSSDSLTFAARDNPYTSDRARRELGWSPPIPPEVGVPEAFRWWREQHP